MQRERQSFTVLTDGKNTFISFYDTTTQTPSAKITSRMCENLNWSKSKSGKKTIQNHFIFLQDKVYRLFQDDMLFPTDSSNLLFGNTELKKRVNKTPPLFYPC